MLKLKIILIYTQEQAEKEFKEFSTSLLQAGGTPGQIRSVEIKGARELQLDVRDELCTGWMFITYSPAIPRQ